MWNSLMTLKYRQGHRHSYQLKADVWFSLAISVSVDVSYIISEILDLGGWNDLRVSFKVIKSGTNRKLVYDFLLLVVSIVTFAVSRTALEKLDVKQSNDLEISLRSSTLASRKGCCVAMYVKCSEDSEWKKRKSPFFNVHTLTWCPSTPCLVLGKGFWNLRIELPVP